MSKDHEILHVLKALREEVTQQNKLIMAAIDNLAAATTALASGVTDLTASVDAAVTDINSLSPTDTQIQAQADAVNGVVTTIAAQTARLVAAVTPPTPVPPTTAAK
jgi:ABC-type transporter Mla subunit MlaD